MATNITRTVGKQQRMCKIWHHARSRHPGSARAAARRRAAYAASKKAACKPAMEVHTCEYTHPCAHLVCPSAYANAGISACCGGSQIKHAGTHADASVLFVPCAHGAPNPSRLARPGRKARTDGSQVDIDTGQLTPTTKHIHTSLACSPGAASSSCSTSSAAQLFDATTRRRWLTQIAYAKQFVLH